MTPARTPTIRPFRDDDAAAVRRLFWTTLVGGAPTPFDPAHPLMRSYEALCLDWYLGAGARSASVIVDGKDEPVGYALVCCDQRSARRSAVRASVRFLAAATDSAVRGRLDARLRTFARLRMRDATTLARPRRHDVPDAHAHLNLSAEARNTRCVLAVRDVIDRTVVESGHYGWAGEINTRRGRRARALERSGFTVVGRDPNHTLSWLTGEPVERLTVVRQVERRG